MRLLRHTLAQGYLVVALAEENPPANAVASETAIDPAQPVAAARAAIGALALEYEPVALACAVEERDLGAAVRGHAQQALAARALIAAELPPDLHASPPQSPHDPMKYWMTKKRP